MKMATDYLSSIGYLGPVTARTNSGGGSVNMRRGSVHSLPSRNAGAGPGLGASMPWQYMPAGGGVGGGMPNAMTPRTFSGPMVVPGAPAPITSRTSALGPGTKPDGTLFTGSSNPQARYTKGMPRHNLTSQWESRKKNQQKAANDAAAQQQAALAAQQAEAARAQRARQNALMGFLQQADTAQAEAKAANEQRYADILQGYQQRTAGAAQDIEGLGASERLNIGDRYTTGRAQAEQDLISRGLGNSTVRSSVMRGYDQERDRAMTRLAEDQSNMRLQYLPALEGDRLQFMERRNDVGPDMNQVAALAQSFGQAGYQLTPEMLMQLSAFGGGSGRRRSGGNSRSAGTSFAPTR